MVIDFHTHTFPQTLAARAIGKLSQSARALNYLDGTNESLKKSMNESGIAYSVVMPVVTKASQQENINRNAIELNLSHTKIGIFSFGGIHPDNENYKEILLMLSRNGIKGIKLHPVFQNTYIDDIRYLRIIDCACENNLIIMLHSGYDISCPKSDFSGIKHIVSMLDTLHPQKLILAHMGGWGCWDEVESLIVGRDVWLDTSFSLIPVMPAPYTDRDPKEDPPLSEGQFLRMVKKHGADRILFGTDSPWDGQKKVLKAIKSLNLTENEKAKILGENAAGLLNILKGPSKLKGS